jgi:hypothetical protein
MNHAPTRRRRERESRIPIWSGAGRSGSRWRMAKPKSRPQLSLLSARVTDQAVGLLAEHSSRQFSARIRCAFEDADLAGLYREGASSDLAGPAGVHSDPAAPPSTANGRKAPLSPLKAAQGARGPCLLALPARTCRLLRPRSASVGAVPDQQRQTWRRSQQRQRQRTRKGSPGSSRRMELHHGDSPGGCRDGLRPRVDGGGRPASLRVRG